MSTSAQLLLSCQCSADLFHPYNSKPAFDSMFCEEQVARESLECEKNIRKHMVSPITFINPDSTKKILRTMHTSRQTSG